MSYGDHLMSNASGAVVPGLRVTEPIVILNSDILTLPTTPIELVPTPGANKIINFVMALGLLNSNAGAYTNIDAGGYSYIQYGSGTQIGNFLANDSTLVPPRAYLSNLFGAAGKGYIQFLPYVDTVETSLWGNLSIPLAASGSTNFPLELIWNNGGSGNLTGGNGANTLTIVVYYFIEEL